MRQSAMLSDLGIKEKARCGQQTYKATDKDAETGFNDKSSGRQEFIEAQSSLKHYSF